MAANNEPVAVDAQQAVFGELSKNWGWLMVLGIVFIFLGTIGLGMTFALTLASVFLFGILFLLGGVLQIVEAFKCKGWKGILWHVVIAVLYIIAGGIVIGNPLGASIMLTLAFAGILIGAGLVRIIMAVQLRGSANWIWPLIGGIASIILGGIFVAGWPISGLWVIGLFIAIEMIIHGWSYIFVALAAKAAGKEASEPGGGTVSAEA
jgi:uncharacterized membrane protein HdeD (DUF308 family)